MCLCVGCVCVCVCVERERERQREASSDLVPRGHTYRDGVGANAERMLGKQVEAVRSPHHAQNADFPF